MADRVPERLRWAVETLAVEPGDRVLEIGCGSGVAAKLVCEQLDAGRMLAIDRSPTQIDRARQRSAAHVSSGRLELATTSLADLDVGARRFDKAFAVNVNVVWTGAAMAELARIREALDPGAVLLLVYESPGASVARRTAARVFTAVAASGFAEPELLSPSATLLGVKARS